MQEIKLNSGELKCSCGDPIYTGLPCRHLIALVCREEQFGYQDLPFNPRWRKNYFIENQEDQEPEDLDPINKQEENEPLVKEN